MKSNPVEKPLTSKIPRLIAVTGFFTLFLLTGILIYDNYGVHWDEGSNQLFGEKWCKYILRSVEERNLIRVENDITKFHRKLKIIPHSNPKTIKTGEHDIRHGPAVEMLLFGANNKVFKFSDPRDVILFRHISNFLIFYFSVFIFYLLSQKIFRNWKIALLGCLFLVLHPRIFSHSFYNTVDIPFLSFYIISSYTFIQFLERKSYPASFCHALACAILIDIRSAGIIVPLCTFLFFGFEILISHSRAKALKSLALYMPLLILFTLLFWPYLWSNPFNNFVYAVIHSAKFDLRAVSPWYYNPVWILVTTPITYSLFFVCGLLLSLRSFLKNPKDYYIRHKHEGLVLLLFLIPLVLTIVFKTTLFDGWRHHYFLYPAFVVVSMIGVSETFNAGMKYLPGRAKEMVFSGMTLILVISFIHVFYFMFKYHPNENVYANILAGKNARYAKFDGALDYWGLSYRNILVFILKNENSGDTLKVYATDHTPARMNTLMLYPENRKRLKFTNRKSADYLMTNYRRVEKETLPGKDHEIYALKVCDEKISGVYKLD